MALDRRTSRWGAAALLVVGGLAGSLLTTPSVAHLNDRASHNWKAHYLARGQKAFLERSKIRTIVVTEPVGGGQASGIDAECPNGYIATGGGGVGDTNFFDVVVTAPLVKDSNNYLSTDGRHGAPNGWTATFQNNDTEQHFAKTVVVCTR